MKSILFVLPVSTDTIIHATNSADGSVQHVAQQPVITTGSAHHAPVTPVLHPAGLATEQYPEVKTETSICIFHFVYEVQKLHDATFLSD